LLGGDLSTASTDTLVADTAGLTTPPHNTDAEEAVIGSVLIDPESFFDVAQFLKAEDFYLVKHRWIWAVFVALHDARTPIDLLTVQEELESREQLGEVGGPAYLTRLVTLTPTAFNAPAYGRLVEEASTRRRLIHAASEIAKLAYDIGTDVNTAVGESEKALFGVSENRNLHELKPMVKAASEYYDRIQYLYDHRGELIGVPTGFKDMDKLLGGFQASDLIIMAGRPGRGKTSLLLSVALNAAKIYKKRVAIFSLEMSTEQLVQRLVAQETGINSQRLRMGQLEDDEWPRFTQAITLLGETGIYLDDTPAISALQLRTKCRRLNSEIRLDMVVVDYLQLMTSDTRVENRVQEVSQISRNLKALARELNVPVLTAAQLSRAVEQRSGQKPMLSDLRESGSIEQDADIVMFLHHPDDWNDDPQKKSLTEIVVAKHRNGPTGSVELVFLEQLTKFADAETRRFSLE
jgi:replicative DNA helicase